MGAALFVMGIFSMAVLITIYGVLMAFDPERFRRVTFFLNPPAKKFPWVLGNIYSVQYKIAGIILAFMGLAMLYLLLSRGLVTSKP